MAENILALYDCRSKQEYIYRTNKVKEITGASSLLAGIFKDFFEDENNGFKISTDWKNSKAPQDYINYFNSSGLDAEIIYEGGGNLCVFFKDRETYIAVNKKLSRQVIDKTFNVSIIASGVAVTGDFEADRKKLYAENAARKNLGNYFSPCNVLPFTLTDTSYQPVVKEVNKGGSKVRYTSESLRKAAEFERIAEKDKASAVFENEFDKMTDKGIESLLAVIYIDGNNMGAKVKDATGEKNGSGELIPYKDYSKGINALRAFSVKTNSDFVDAPVKAISERLEHLSSETGSGKHRLLFRQIIGGGDEITLVCNARAVPHILSAYFDTLTSNSSNSACAGVAVFHSHAPFSDVYRIAEACCESGKEISHIKGNEDKNYIDFHFCHAGITNDLETVREHQEAGFTARPYEYSSTWQEFTSLGRKLSTANRADVKSLSEAIVKGDSYYKEALRMIQSRGKLCGIDESEEKTKKMIFDASIVYDLWFAERGADKDE
ncbi:MAG: hypothetical protein ACI4JJ_07950 [Huintestinicola sp.]